MPKTVSIRTATRTSNRRQAYTLFLLGILCLLGAMILHLNPLTYPIGLFLFGFGMLIAAFFNPYRLMMAGILTTLIGIAIFFAFKPIIPDGGSILYLAIGLGLIGIAVAGRRGYVGAGAFTPGIIVIIAGLVEYGPTTHFFPKGFIPFILSLWFPGLGLVVLGVIYFLLSSREREGSIGRLRRSKANGRVGSSV